MKANPNRRVDIPVRNNTRITAGSRIYPTLSASHIAADRNVRAAAERHRLNSQF